MILESRSLIFSDEELILAFDGAVQAYFVSDNKQPAAVTAVTAGLDEFGDPLLFFTFAGGGKHVFQSREIAPILLNHCIDSGIPLPRGAYKELALRGNRIALIVRLETGLGIVHEDQEY